MKIQEEPTDSSFDDSVIATQVIQSTEEKPASVLTVTFAPTGVINVQEKAIQTPTAVSDSTKQPTPTSTSWSTATPLPLPTNTLEPSPTAIKVECQNTGTLPIQTSPSSVDIDSAHIAVNGDFLYLAVEHYIGVFDIINPEFPEFLGFWQFPNMPDILDIVVDNGIVYIVNGLTIQALNASPQCQFEKIATIDVPFQVFQLASENGNLYAGGGSESQGIEQVVIFSTQNPKQPEELGTIDLGQEPAIWSIFQETLYSLSGDKLTVTDVSNPAIPHVQPVNLTLDSEVLRYTPQEFVKDTLYLLWGSDTLTIISDLDRTSPTVTRHNDNKYIMIDVFQVQESYIFLGINSCDVECASGVLILDADDGQKIASVSLYPYYPVYDYQEIERNLVYAFSDNTLVVVDISDGDKPEIINEVQFIR